MVCLDNRSFPLYAMLAGVCSVRLVRFLMVMNIVSEMHFGLVNQEYICCGDCSLLCDSYEKLSEYYTLRCL